MKRTTNTKATKKKKMMMMFGFASTPYHCRVRLSLMGTSSERSLLRRCIRCGSDTRRSKVVFALMIIFLAKRQSCKQRWLGTCIMKPCAAAQRRATEGAIRKAGSTQTARKGKRVKLELVEVSHGALASICTDVVQVREVVVGGREVRGLHVVAPQVVVEANGGRASSAATRKTKTVPDEVLERAKIIRKTGGVPHPFHIR